MFYNIVFKRKYYKTLVKLVLTSYILFLLPIKTNAQVSCEILYITSNVTGDGSESNQTNLANAIAITQTHFY